MNCISVLIYDALIGDARNLQILECQIQQGYIRWNIHIYIYITCVSFHLFHFLCFVWFSYLSWTFSNTTQNLFIYFFWRKELTNDSCHIPCVSVMHPWISIPLKILAKKSAGCESGVSGLYGIYILWIWLCSVLRKLIVQLIVAQWQNGYWRTVLNLKIWIGMEYMSYQ